MLAKELLSPILDDDTLTRGLGDAEARVLIEWLVERSEEFHARGTDNIGGTIRTLCGRARAVARFVQLWCHQRDHGAACQLAATQRFTWPFPATNADPCDVMLHALAWE